MRAVLAAALLLCLAVPAASAQMYSTLDLQVAAPTDPVGAEGAKVALTLTLICPNPAAYMPDQVVRLEIQGVPGSIIEGPESVIFSSRLCLQQSSDVRTADYVVKLPADAPGDSTFTYTVKADPAYTGNQLFPQANPAEARFTLASPPAPPSPPMQEAANLTVDQASAAAEQMKDAADNGQVMDVPAPSWLVAILGIGLAALRRR